MTTGKRTLSAFGTFCFFAALSVSQVSFGQNIIEGTEELDFDRTEAWAMKYMTSVTLFSGLGVPLELEAGQFEIGFESGIVPQLSEEKRIVGFDGTKLEDLNKSRFFGRPRVNVGLGSGVSLGLGYVPPVDVGGVKPNLFAVSLAKAQRLSDTTRLGIRGFGQFGTIKGDITCDADTVAGGGNLNVNPFGCEQVSDDEYTQRTYGGEVSIGFSQGGVVEPYVSFGLSYMDLEFQVNALYSGLDDRTLQLTSGTTYNFTGGLRLQLTQNLYGVAELFYTPLSVIRPPNTESQNDSLFNWRFLLTYRLR